MWSNDKTPDVVHSIYRSAVKGNPMSQLLWLQYFKGFAPKSQLEQVQKVEVSEQDIRFIIEALPEPHRTKFYGYIDEIVTTANTFRNAHDVDEADWLERPAENVRGETDNDAQEFSDAGSDAVAKGDQAGIRRNMVRPLSANNYQSTSRRWQE
jgi:hypothetical protein